MACSAPVADACVRGLAQQILARSEYARWRAPDLGWLHRLLEAFASFLGWFDGLRQALPFAYWAMLIGLLLLGVALLAHVAWSIRIALTARVEPIHRDQPPPGPRFAEEAAELASRGLNLEAAHRMELACIELLLRAGALDLRRHHPNRVLRGRIASSPLLCAADRSLFLDLLDRLETRWFRDRSVEVSHDSLYEQWCALHGRLLTALEGT